MQALAERLDAALAGRTLDAAEALQFSALKTYSPGPGDVAGARLERVWRRGKYLVAELETARLVVHLSQGGRIEIEEPPRSTRPKGALARFRFGPTGVLLREYGTQRKAGWWLLARSDDGPLEGLGPEPFDDAFAALILEGGDRRPLYSMLRDQRTVAGIGRGYTDDSLHEARLGPFTTLASLDRRQRVALLDAVHGVLERALASERRRRGGLPAKLGDRFTVHGRAGRPCPRCGDTLRRVSFESYELVYCPACQTGGRVLADRRLSRLIR